MDIYFCKENICIYLNIQYKDGVLQKNFLKELTLNTIQHKVNFYTIYGLHDTFFNVNVKYYAGFIGKWYWS